jgi:IS605 OrfB family transposase
MKMLAVEDLKNLKRGKKKSRGKSFRKALAPWSCRQVIEAIRQKAQEHGVDLVLVPPAYTSRTCPKCGTESVENRKGETFHCIDCEYTADADTVGAVNVLNKALRSVGSVESPAFTAC